MFVVLTVVAATQDRHWLAALVRLISLSAPMTQRLNAGQGRQLGAISCTFRQTNIVWVLYAYATSQVMKLRFQRAPANGKPLPKLHDPLALAAQPGKSLR